MATSTVKNVEVSVTPHPKEIPGICAGGYFWPMGVTTTRVVDKVSADELELESKRQAKNPVTKKMQACTRYVFARGAETDRPAEKQIEKQLGRVQMASSFDLKSDSERQTDALTANLLATQEVLKELRGFRRAE